MPPSENLGTFLYTDIEGSTRLWELHPEVMPRVLERHDAILRAAVEGEGGEVVKTTGDGLLARFEDPIAALRCATAGQRTIGAMAGGAIGALRVRMAVHAGSAHARDGDYFGPALNRAARLLAIGHGGQILASAAVAGLVASRLPDGVILIDRGKHRLKDLEEPEHVFQVVATGLPAEFPPLRSLGAGPTNLPVQLTSFIGRERELEEIGRSLAQHRLVTLVGVGGTGKTRLMLQAAAEVTERFSDGVWVTELAAVTDRARVAPELARSLGVPEQPGRSLSAQLVDYLRDKQLLLLLDNCEHLVGAVAELVDRLLAACPRLVILASSREALGVSGELAYAVPSLGLPPTLPNDPESALAALVDAEAIRLFVDRATLALPSFTLNTANVSAVAEMCRRLDGIPLAIELAAARVTVLSPGEIVERLDDRFRLLTGGRRTSVPRQQTLQALIDWSWDLLSDADRVMLRRVSVFRGGWTLEAAASVCGHEGARPDPIDTLDGLGRLVERSLIIVDRGDVTRYRLLETIRQYAASRLIESGETLAVRDRHLAYFEAFAQRAGSELRGRDLEAWMRRLDAEADNVRAAIAWGLETDPERAGRLAVAIWLHWRFRSNGIEGWGWLSEAASRVRALPVPPDAGAARERRILLSRLLAEASFAGTTWADVDARSMAEEAVAMARTEQDGESLVHGLAALWTALFFHGPREGLGEIADEQLRIAEARGDLWALALAEAAQAGSLLATDPGRADALLRTAVEHARQTENPFAIAFVALTMARLQGMRGHVPAMRAAFEEAIDAYSRLGDNHFVLIGNSDLAHGLRRAGELDEAETLLRETIVGWAHLGARSAVANQLESFALLALARGRLQRAARLLGAAEALRASSGSMMLSHERAEYDAAVGRLRAAMDPDDLEAAWRAGRGDAMAAAIQMAVEG